MLKFSVRTGVAEFTLDSGKCPRWLFARMSKLARAIGYLVIREFGPVEFLRRLADPVWFQSLGCVMAFDWNASGLTTTTLGALKYAFRDLQKDLGVFFCGGKGVTSRKTPEEIKNWSWRLGISEKNSNRLEYSSRAAAKVDSSLIQDGFQLYHHNFIFTRSGHWCVVQQGMNKKRGRARRYHWFGDSAKDYIQEPHTGIASQIFLPKVLNLTAKESQKNREIGVKIINNPKTFLSDIKIITANLTDQSLRLMSLPNREYHHHPVEKENFSLENPQFRRAVAKAIAAQPATFENMLMTEGVGPKTIRAISLVAEVVYGVKPSYEDPARYSFAFGGKDGTPYFVDRSTYDKTLAIIQRAIRTVSGLTWNEKNQSLYRAEKAFRIKKPPLFSSPS